MFYILHILKSILLKTYILHTIHLLILWSYSHLLSIMNPITEQKTNFMDSIGKANIQ